MTSRRLDAAFEERLVVGCRVSVIRESRIWWDRWSVVWVCGVCGETPGLLSDVFSVSLLLMVQRRAEGPQMFERWRQDGDYGFERPEQVNAVLLSIDPQHTCGLLKNTWLHKITLINTPSDVMQYFCLMAACDVRLIITSTAWILYERAACDARWEPRSTFTVSHTVINTLG